LQAGLWFALIGQERRSETGVLALETSVFVLETGVLVFETELFALETGLGPARLQG